MTKFSKIYQDHKTKKEQKKIQNKNLKRVGYGYIKRRLGLLSTEVGTPTYIENEEKIK